MALKENLQNYLKKGVQASKEAFSKAETAVTKFGDESVLKIEKKQFEAKLRKEIASLGQSALDAFEKNIPILPDQEPFLSHLNTIKNLKAEIQQREDLLKEKQNQKYSGWLFVPQGCTKTGLSRATA